MTVLRARADLYGKQVFYSTNMIAVYLYCYLDGIRCSSISSKSLLIMLSAQSSKLNCSPFSEQRLFADLREQIFKHIDPRLCLYGPVTSVPQYGPPDWLVRGQYFFAKSIYEDKIRNCLDLFGTPMAIKTSSG